MSDRDLSASPPLATGAIDIAALRLTSETTGERFQRFVGAIEAARAMGKSLSVRIYSDPYAAQREQAIPLDLYIRVEPERVPATAREVVQWDDDEGEMKPTLPPKIAEALATLRAMTEPYFDQNTANRAEHALREAIVAHLKVAAPQALDAGTSP